MNDEGKKFDVLATVCGALALVVGVLGIILCLLWSGDGTWGALSTGMASENLQSLSSFMFYAPFAGELIAILGLVFIRLSKNINEFGFRVFSKYLCLSSAILCAVFALLYIYFNSTDYLMSL